MIGRRGKAPCGHDGEHVVGNYVRCDKCDRKDAVPTHVTPEKTQRICPGCGSSNVAPFTLIVEEEEAEAYHCWSCGAVWNA